MTLTEAIDVGERYFNLHHNVPRAEVDEAARLFIEAGQLVESLRVGVPRHIVRLLPGESRE